MTLSVERAAKGHRKSMAALYEAYKTSLYSFCCILMDDTQKAEIAVTRTVRAIWSQLSVKHARTEEDFRRLLLMEAVRICRAMLFGKDSRGFKVSKIEPVELPAFSETAYTGDVEAGMETLQAVLETVGPHRRFIYLLHAAGGLSFAEIAAVIRQRGAVARYGYEKTVAALARGLKNSGDGTLLVEHTQSLLEQAAEHTLYPAALDAACLQLIRSSARRPSLPKKLWVPALCILLAVGICVSAALAVGYAAAAASEADAEAAAESEASQTSETASEAA